MRVAAVLCTFAVADGRITPALHPASDKQFMGKDLPDDGRAFDVTKEKFGYPYPVVQKSSDFDTDYVKDENNDNGEWQAQMHYDMLRAKVRRAKEELAKAESMTAKEKSAYDAAYQKALDAGHSVEEAHKRAMEAANKSASTHAKEEGLEKDAADKRKHASELKSGDVDKADLEAAKENLAKEEAQFKICEEQLKKAKEDLEKAIADEAAADKASEEGAAKQKASLDAEANKDSADANALKGKEAQALADEKAAADEAAKADEAVKGQEGWTANQKKAWKLAHMGVDEAQAYVDKVWKELAMAEKRLKCFRKHGGPCPKKDFEAEEAPEVASLSKGSEGSEGAGNALAKLNPFHSGTSATSMAVLVAAVAGLALAAQ